MLDINEATKVIKKNIPDGKIQAMITYNDLYIFQVFTDRPFEEEMDPFYSVNQQTGEFRDFSIITDGDPAKVVSLFKAAKRMV